MYLWATKEALPKIEQQKEQQQQQQEHPQQDNEQQPQQPNDESTAKTSSSSETVYLHDEGHSDGDRRTDKKFVFTPVEDISPWEAPEEREVGGGRVFPPSATTEDHILREGENGEEEEEEEVDVVEVDGREHLWFVGEEEKVRVRGKESRLDSFGGGSSSSGFDSFSSSSGTISRSGSSSREHEEVIRYLISEERLAAFVEERNEGRMARGL